MDKKNKYLYRYNSLEDIMLENYKTFDWKISNDSISSRSERVKGYNFFEKIKNDSKKFSNKIDNQEIVSWLDSLSILKKLLKNEKLNDKIKKDIVIFQEYLIPYSNNYRADFLLCLGNKILILEFSYNNFTKNYDDKLFQALRYKEILQTIIPSDHIVGQFIFSYHPEYEKDLSTVIPGNIEINQKTLETLIKLINKFFDLESSSNMLEKLE